MSESARSVAGDAALPEPLLLGQFIPLHYHYQMLRDQARREAFREAIERTVQPGMKVLELGGGTGFLSFLAARCGAQVRCVECNPALVAAARRFLGMNEGGDRVEVIQADAFDYLPPEPVDVVICEMLHVGLLREKQVPVLAAFQRRYGQAFGLPLPRFLPEASLLAVQPVQQSFRFAGYHAPIPLFQTPGGQDGDCQELGSPLVHQVIDYQKALPQCIHGEGLIAIQQLGSWNALRFVTKNVLAVLVAEQRTIDWWNQYLVLPLEEPRIVHPGELVRIEFSYEAGAPLEALSDSLQVSSEADVPAPSTLRRQAA